MVLNGLGKGRVKICHVRIEKMNANEPLLNCRENALFVKTVGGLYHRKNVADYLFCWLHDKRHEGGMISI